MKKITECPDVVGKYIIVRSSCNVPLQDGVVTNSYRLTRALPTLTYLQKAGAKVIVIAHIGRDENDTLKPVLTAFKELIAIEWGGMVGSEEFIAARNAMQNGDIILAENLRQWAGEVENSLEFAQLLASQADIYVNDAFDNVHRDHASMVTLPTLLPAYAGITLYEEVTELQKAMKPVSPSLLILGGAKFETKMPLVEKYLALYDNVFVTGALVNDILKAEGKEVGLSLVSDISLAGEEFLASSKLIKAVDVIAQNERGLRTVSIDGVQPDEKITDMGPVTVAKLAPYISEAATILWNGPLGLYESGAPGGTHAVAKLIAEASGYSIIGGGDTVAAIEELGLNEKFGFVSIGGGAMLTFLEHGTTPSLEALN